MDLPDPFYALGDHIGIELPGARAVFTTRAGGLSGPPYDSLNLGLLTDDDQPTVAENRRRLAAELGVRFAYSRQVHGALLRVAEQANDPGVPPIEGDGVLTATRGVAPLVLGADCLTVVIAGQGVVGAVHAGWPGLAQRILPAAVSALRELANARGARSGEAGGVAAAIGPSAGVCCYEVGPELLERFAELGHGDRHAGRHLDLKGIAADQLRAAGVQEVYDVGLCTICAEPGLLYSHRRDKGVTGRQAGIGWLT